MINFNFRVLSFLFCTLLFSSKSNSQTAHTDWFKSIGGVSDQTGDAIKVDGSGNVYSAGSFQGLVNFSPGESATSTSDYDAYICKFDTSGLFDWAYTYSGTNNQNIYDLDIDASDNLYFSGVFQGAVDFDPSSATVLLQAEYSEGFVSKLNSQGGFEWAKKFESSDTSIVKSMILDPYGNVFVAGYFDGTTDFDPDTGVFNLTSGEHGDLFICKLDGDGDFLWANSYPGNEMYSSDINLAMDNQGSVIASGEFYDTVDFNAGPGVYEFIPYSTISSDIFVLKLKPNGDFKWAKQIGGPRIDLVRDVVVDDNNNVYLTGSFQEECDFDPNEGIELLETESTFEQDIFLCKLNWLGDFEWVKHFKGFGLQLGTGLALDDSTNIYITGNFWSSVDFDPHLTQGYAVSSEGMDDVFVTKLDVDGNFRWSDGYGSTLPDVPGAIAIDENYNIYTTGVFQDTMWSNMEDSVSLGFSLGGRDAFIHKLYQGPEIIDEDTSGVGMGEIEWELALFPNPTMCNFTIDLGAEMTDVQIEITNSIGQLIERRNCEDGALHEFNLSGGSGLYFVKVKTSMGYEKRYKLVKM